MSEGRVIQFDTPQNILRNPATTFVEELIGEDRLLQAKPDTTPVKEVMLKTPIAITPEKSFTRSDSPDERKTGRYIISDG